MANATKFVIADNDTARAIGLKHLLEQFYNADVYLSQSPESDHSADDDISTRYLVSADMLVRNIDFFIARRQRTTVINGSGNNSGMTSIDSTTDESELIEQLGALIVPKDESVSSTTLSQREIEVLRLVAMGFINKEIADTLSISFNTVLTHRRNITAKLGIKSVSGLGVYALMNGYIRESDLKR